MMLKSKKATNGEEKQKIRGPLVEIFFYRHHEESRLRPR